MPREISLAFRTRAELNDELEALAKATDRSKSWHIERALEAYLEYERDVAEKIKEGLADIEAGRTVPLGTDHELPDAPKSRTKSRQEACAHVAVKLIWSDAALTDLRAIQRWIGIRNPAAARRMLAGRSGWRPCP